MVGRQSNNNFAAYHTVFFLNILYRLTQLSMEATLKHSFKSPGFVGSKLYKNI